MSYQNFHRWGERNYDELIDITRGTNYPTSFVDEGAVESGETAFNETFEGTMSFVKNPLFAGGSANGIFVDGTMNILSASTGIFARRWVQPNTSTDETFDEGANVVAEGEKCIGITWNWNVNTNDLSAVQIAGVAYVALDGTYNAAYPAYASTDVLGDGKIDLSSSIWTTNSFGKSCSDSPYSGFCTIIINTTETR